MDKADDEVGKLPVVGANWRFTEADKKAMYNYFANKDDDFPEIKVLNGGYFSDGVKKKKKTNVSARKLRKRTKKLYKLMCKKGRV